MKAIASNQTIAWFFQRYREESLELSADFQRNPVWLQPQKEYLIETILLDLPVPEVYMVNRINPTGQSIYIVVDGQQRLRTIIEFITEELVIKERFEKYPNVKRFTDLSDQEKQRFWRYPIVVRDLEDSSDNDIRNLFQRINKYSVPLNEQELRNAKFKGYFLQTIQQLSENDYWPISGIFSANDFRRMIDLEFISILLTTMIGGIYNRKDRIDEFYVMYENEFEDSNFYKDRFNRILETIDDLIPEMKLTRWRNKAEFYTLFLVADDLQFSNATPELMVRIKERLYTFAGYVQDAKSNPENAESLFRDYLDAATYGTNDKEKRIRRHQILKKYLHDNLGI
jgi:uncharacterized protein with ParB-like and HNH nuclease domain